MLKEYSETVVNPLLVQVPSTRHLRPVPFPSASSSFVGNHQRRHQRAVTAAVTVAENNDDDSTTLSTTALTDSRIWEVDRETGNTALHLAAADGDINRVISLLSQLDDADVNLENLENATALHLAVSNNRSAIVHLLLAHGADVEARFLGQSDKGEGSDGEPHVTSLILASSLGLTEIAGELIAHGAHVNDQNRNGQTPLHYAILNGNSGLLTLLLAHGADVEARYRESDDLPETLPHITALMGASSLGLTEIAGELIDHGARVNDQDRNGQTPLHYAILNGNSRLVALLLARGADVEARYRRPDDPSTIRPHMTALMQAAFLGLPDIAKQLLSSGARTNDTDIQGLTPLYFAVATKVEPVNASLDTVRLLLNHGAQVNARDPKGVTPLHAAAAAGNAPVTAMLLAHGSDVGARFLQSNGPFTTNVTALYLAIIAGQTDTAKILLEHGARVQVNDADMMGGRTPLDFVTMRGNATLVSFLLANGADVNAVNRLNQTALIFAVRNNRSAIVRLLLDYGADVQIPYRLDSDPSEAKPQATAILTAAAVLGSQEIVRLLLDHGARVNDVSRDGSTPLHFAAEIGDHSVLVLLLANSANVNAEDRWNQTALVNAVWNNRSVIVHLLLEHGADVEARFRESNDLPETWPHMTALMGASSLGLTDIAGELIDHGARVNDQNRNGLTPLHYAILNGNSGLVALLLAHGADVESRYRNRNESSRIKPHMTALMLAANLDSPGIAEQLLAHGASVNDTDRHGLTPLHYAISYNVSAPLISLLLTHGADPLRKALWDSDPPNTSPYLTPMRLAERMNNTVAMKLLKDAQLQWDKANPLQVNATLNIISSVSVLGNKLVSI
jgi:ankyrin repeat protein